MNNHEFHAIILREYGKTLLLVAVKILISFITRADWEDFKEELKRLFLAMSSQRPQDLVYLPVQYHQIRYDPSHAAAGIQFADENFFITQNVSVSTHKCVFATEGYRTGIHYWEQRIIDDASDKYIMIGVSKNASVTISTFPGHGSDKGVSYYGNNGYRYFANTHAGFGSIFKSGDVIGTLLNMEHKTVTFYLNGQRVGTALGADYLTDDIYYPVVALHSLGHTVVSLPPAQN